MSSERGDIVSGTTPTPTPATSGEAASVGLWHSMAVRDAGATIAWLQALGFHEHATHRAEDDPAVVEHAEWVWPGGGGVMFGTHREGGGAANVGGSAVYLVTEDPDGLHACGLGAGGTSAQEPIDQPYGGRTAAVLDPDGNQWSFGSYRPGAQAG